MLKDERGFTLIELIAVLVLMSILGTIAAKKFINFDNSASQQVVSLAIEELNVREKLCWANATLMFDKQDIDGDVWEAMSGMLDIGNNARVDVASGVITVGDASAEVVRTAATRERPGFWKRK
jgi:prepilin-type N-terminal cleavage/methylation domain-containing protein